MSRFLESSGTTFETAPSGNHPALCIRIVDIGTQEGEYAGQPTKRRQLIVTWELPLELREDEQPFIISKFYTASVGEKSNLYKDLTSWLGKPPKAPFDIKTLLGKPCQVVVSERENSDKRVVSSVTSLTKGIKLPDTPHNPLVFFSLDKDEYDENVLEGLSQGIKNMIFKSPEYADIMSPPEEVGEADKDGDIPF